MKFLSVLYMFCFLFSLLSAKEEYKVIDVSHHQEEIDWKKVKEAGIEGAIIRCGFGQIRKKMMIYIFYKI